MILHEYHIEHRSRADRFYIYCIGDIHLGNRACNVDMLRRHVEEVRTNPHARWIGMGDMIEAINYTDKRFDPTQIADKYLDNLSNAANEQMCDLITILQPIKDKCIGMHRGNHEETLRLKYHYDVLREIEREWPKARMFEDTAFTVLHFKRQHHVTTFILWTAHGNVGGRKSGGKINRIEDAMGMFDADIYILAHGHRKIITSLNQLSVNVKGELHLVAKRRVGAMTGAYFKTYQEGVSTYAEKGMFSPSDLGAIKITIDPSDRNYFISEI